MKNRTKMFLSLFPMALWLISFGPVDAATLTAGADTYVKGNSTADNSAGDLLEIRYSTPSAGARKTYIRFPLDSVSGDATNAAFKLTLANLPQEQAYSPFLIYGLNDGDSDEGWNPNTINYTNCPAYVSDAGSVDVNDATLLGTLSLGTATTNDYGTAYTMVENTSGALTNFINSDTDRQVTFIVLHNDWQTLGFASSENATYNGPELILDGVTAVAQAVPSVENLSIDEGSSNTFGVRLSIQPVSTTTVTVSRVGDSDITVSSGASLVFIPAEWDIDQTVTLSAAQDEDVSSDSATIHCTVVGGGSTDVTATEIDDDTLAVVVSSDTLNMEEGTNATFQVKLSHQPSASVTVTSSRVTGGSTNVSVTGGGSQVFGTGDWGTFKTVTVTAEHDADITDEAAVISCASPDAVDETVDVTVSDDDKADIILSTHAVSVVEGTTNSTVTIVLSLQPPATTLVTADWVSGDDGLQIRPTLLPFVFTTNNWNTQQVVQVLASEDFDGTNGTALIQFSATGLDTVDLNATEIDNDDIVIPLREMGIWSGTNGVIPVKLAAVPAGDTTVTVENVAGNANISVTSGSPLIFTTGNWDIYQTSTVHVASDADTLCTPATLSASAPGLASCDVEVWEQETATYFITTNILQATPGRIGSFMPGQVMRPYYPFQMRNAWNACITFEPVMDWEHGHAHDGGTNWLWSPFIPAANDGVGHWRFYGDGYFDGQSISFFREESNTLSLIRTETITSFEGSTGSSERIYFTTTNGVAPIQSNDWYVIQSQWVNTPSNSGSFNPKEWLYSLGTGTVYEHDDTTAAPEWDSTTSLKVSITDGTGGGVYELIGRDVDPQDYRTLQTNRTYTFSAWLKHSGLSNPSVTFSINGTSVSTNFTVGTGWQKFTHTFVGESNPNTYFDMRLKTAGAGTLWVDNMILYDAAMEPLQVLTNVVAEAKALKPESFRSWHLLHLPIKELLRKPEAALSPLDRSYDTEVGSTLPWILEFCKEVESDPWITFNVFMTPDEHHMIMEYLVGATNTTYGALRADHGHPAPWTDEFETIYIECHNEAWNAAFEVNFSPDFYDNVAEYFSAQFKSDPLFNTNDFRMIASGTSVSATWNETVANNVPSADIIDTAFYIGGWDGFTIPGGDETELFKNQLYYSPRIVEPNLEVFIPMATAAGKGMAQYEGGPGYPVPSAGQTYDPDSEYYGKSLALAVACIDEFLYMAAAGFESINHYHFGAGRNWVTHSDYVSMRRHALTHAMWLYQQKCNGPMLTAEDYGVRTINIPDGKGYKQAWDGTIKDVTLPGRENVDNVVSYSFVDSNDVYSVLLFSREIEMETPVRIQLPFVMASTGTIYRIEADSPAAQNTYSNEVEVVETALTGLSGSGYDVTLKPYSIVLVQLYPAGDTPTVPTAPSGLTATNVQASQVDLVWADNSSDEAWFVIERRLSSSSNYTVVAQVDGSSYIDVSMVDGSEYVYRVRAYNLAGYSGESTCTADVPYGGDRFVEPIADAATSSFSPDVNYGTSSTMDAGGTRRINLKFDMLSIGGTVTSATVRLYHNSYGDTNDTLRLYALTNDWAEDTITWNNQPASGSLLDTTVSAGVGTWVEFDVVDHIQAMAMEGNTNTVVSFAMDSTLFSRYSSKENSDFNAPQLTLNYGGEPLVAMIEVSTSAVSVAEGSTNTFNVRLDRFVSTPQTVTAARVSGNTNLTVSSGSSRVFNSTTWSNWQTVTLSAAQDDNASDGSATIRCSGAYVSKVDITVSEVDDDILDIETSVSLLDVNEGSSHTFDVRLTAQPEALSTVSVSRVSGGSTNIIVSSGSSLLFTTTSWNVWTSVTVSASSDEDWTNDTATLRCSSTGLSNQDVAVTAIDSDTDPVRSLPWMENFEGGVDNADMGALDSQHGWTADAGAVVQTGTVHGGSQALSLSNAVATHTFDGAPTEAWITFWAVPVASEHVPQIIETNAAALFYVNTNSQIVAYDSTNATVLITTVSNGWNKFEIHCDYSSNVWNLSLNDEQVVTNFAFYGSPAAFSTLELTEGSRDYTAYVDDIQIADSLGDDSDGDGLPDSWEEQYYGDLSPNPGDLSSNGVNTVLDAYIAGLDPTDPEAQFILNSLGPLMWNATSGRVYTIYWTSNLLNVFQALETNYSGGVFTDTTHGAKDKGFYKIEVELE